MKRPLATLLSLALALSLTACGSSGETADTVLPASSQAGNTLLEDASTSAPEQTPEPPAAEDGAGSANEQPAGADTQPSDLPQAVAPSSGGTAQPSPPQSVPPTSQPTAAAPQTTTPAPAETAPAVDTPRILIAYFTWADNTVVEDPGTIDVDATTSASVLAPGNTAKMAAWIHSEVGGDLHSITVAEPYSSDYDECLDRAADEKADNARPTLTSSVTDFEGYDVVFLGFPNWWYTLPMPVLSFVDAYDWSGKTVIPFVTHGTGGLASTMRDLDAALPDSVTRLDPIGVYRPEVDTSENTVRTWAAGLDLGGAA